MAREHINAPATTPNHASTRVSPRQREIGGSGHGHTPNAVTAVSARYQAMIHESYRTHNTGEVTRIGVVTRLTDTGGPLATNGNEGLLSSAMFKQAGIINTAPGEYHWR